MLLWMIYKQTKFLSWKDYTKIIWFSILLTIERYKLKSSVKSAKAHKRVQHFSEFIKKFSECDADPEAVYEETLKLAQLIKVRS